MIQDNFLSKKYEELSYKWSSITSNIKKVNSAEAALDIIKQIKKLGELELLLHNESISLLV